MNTNMITLAAVSALFVSCSIANAQLDAGGQGQSKTKVSEPQSYLASLAGAWQGTCSTWMQPGVAPIESKVEAEFQLVLGGRFLRHTYKSQLSGKPRKGEETIAYNALQGEFQTSWIDDFHMNYGILFSEGKPSKKGFSVVGQYAVGAGKPPWSWKTVYELIDQDHLTITAYNILPDGREAKAVETKYVRIGK